MAEHEFERMRMRSNKIYVIATNEPFTARRHDISQAKHQREWLLAQVRNAVIDDGKQLLSPSDEASFSKHGSLFHRLTSDKINDIDVYVILNGKGSVWRDNPLCGPSGENTNPIDWKPSAWRKWICDIVASVLASWKVEHKVSLSKRGALITAMGQPKRDYDIIPAFMYKDAKGNHHHIIPSASEDDWQSNPTMLDMKMVIDLDKQFNRNPEEKILGYRDLVKVLKLWKEERYLERSHGVTSFIIRFAVADALMKRGSTFNQKNLESAIEEINGWIGKGGFKDPYTKTKISLGKKKLDIKDVFEFLLS